MLKGERIVVRPLTHEDYLALFRAASDPEIWRQHPDTERYTRHGFEQYFSDALQSGSALTVIESATGEVIGSSRYHGFDPDQDSVETGWTFLARSVWGGLYNRELKELMLSHAFRFVHTILFYIDPSNTRSQRSVEKIGALKELQPDRQGRVVYQLTLQQWNLKCGSER